MAFTETQKSKIRTYLGYTDLFPDYHHFLNNAFEIVSEETQTEIENLLTLLENVDTELTTTVLDTAGLTNVGRGEVEFEPGQKIKDLRTTGRMLAKRIADKLGVSIQNDAFGSNIANGRFPQSFFG